jgi:hypothetical protein
LRGSAHQLVDILPHALTQRQIKCICGVFFAVFVHLQINQKVVAITALHCTLAKREDMGHAASERSMTATIARTRSEGQPEPVISPGRHIHLPNGTRNHDDCPIHGAVHSKS